jgi:cyclic beta-1,2-glucan synthetase
MGFFLFGILGDWADFADARGDAGRAARYRAHRAHLGERLNAEGAGWDGAWFRRAYYDDGTPLGTAAGDECQIDALVQAWSVLSGAATPEHAAQALDAMEARLVDESGGLIRLLTPAFDRTPHDPGYIKGYLPGVRENGGQYTHAALWAVRALAEAGRCERAAPLLAMLSPVSQTDTPEGVARYQAEPYSVAADVYGVAPHVGRGGWTWYTGSAGWMYRVAVESVLGFGIEDGAWLTLAPCLPAAWPGATLRYRVPDSGGTTYTFTVARGDAASATLDGAPVALDGDRLRVPLLRDGADHEVRLTLG